MIILFNAQPQCFTDSTLCCVDLSLYIFHCFLLCPHFSKLLIPLAALFTGEYHCPVLNKVFTEFTHIVAVKTTGNVFSYEVIIMLTKAVMNPTKYCIVLHLFVLYKTGD